GGGGKRQSAGKANECRAARGRVEAGIAARERGSHRAARKGRNMREPESSEAERQGDQRERRRRPAQKCGSGDGERPNAERQGKRAAHAARTAAERASECIGHAFHQFPSLVIRWRASERDGNPNW